MKLNNKQLLEFANGTTTMREKVLPLKLAFAVKHNREEAIRKLQPYEELVKELLERHKDNQQQFLVEIEKLQAETIEVDIKKVSEEIIELTDAEGYDKLTLGELEALDVMLEA